MSTATSRTSTDVVELHSAQDAVDAVSRAREEGRRIVVLSPRDAAPADAGDALVVSTAAMTGVEIDADMWRARVEAGALWRDVSLPASELGLAPLAAQAGDSPVVPDTLHGGVSWLARLHGLACNSLTAVEIVTPDGELVRADFATEPDLFYALRGGGEQLGIVVAVELLLHPVAQLYAGSLMWPIERRRRGPAPLARLGPHRAGRADLGRPPAARRPTATRSRRPFRGRAFVAIEAAYAGCAEAAEAFIDHLRHLQPEIDTFTTMPPAGLLALHGDPECGRGAPRRRPRRSSGRCPTRRSTRCSPSPAPTPRRRSTRSRSASSAARSPPRRATPAPSRASTAEFVAVAVGLAERGPRRGDGLRRRRPR